MNYTVFRSQRKLLRSSALRAGFLGLKTHQRQQLAVIRSFPNMAAAGEPAGPAESSSRQAAEEYREYLEVALAAAREAGAIIKAAWDQPRKVEHKGTFDLVTETDKQCEETVLTRLSSAFPTHKFIGEENSSAQGFTDELTEEPTWMVDPVDGTTNFVHRFPFSCVSIGLAIDRRVVAGVVYNPILDEVFHATRGGGAFRNGQRIAVSQTDSLQAAVFATEVGTSREDAFLDACFDRIRTLVKQCRSLRATGSCALNLCGVACGRLDAYYELGLGGPWDLAAAVLVVEEAGGRVLDPTGGPFNIMSRRVLGTNAHLAEEVSSVLAGCKYAESEPKPQPPPR